MTTDTQEKLMQGHTKALERRRKLETALLTISSSYIDIRNKTQRKELANTIFWASDSDLMWAMEKLGAERVLWALHSMAQWVAEDDIRTLMVRER